MNVQKSDAIALAKGITFNVEHTATNLFEATDRDMSWNQWIGNTFEQALLQVNIGAANFRELDCEQR